YFARFDEGIELGRLAFKLRRGMARVLGKVSAFGRDGLPGELEGALRRRHLGRCGMAGCVSVSGEWQAVVRSAPLMVHPQRVGAGKGRRDSFRNTERIG